MKVTRNHRITRSQQASREIVCALLAQQTPVQFAPRGPSMHPLLRDGDCVRIVPAALDFLRPGHLVLYRAHGRLILHRLIRRKGSGLHICADAALAGCEQVAGTDLLGVAETRWRDGRERQLDTRLARWWGLGRYYARPLRSWAQGVRNAARRKRRQNAGGQL